MKKFIIMLGVWLVFGILNFLFIYLKYRKEIKMAKFELVHICVMFVIFCLAGLPVTIMEIFNLWEVEEESGDSDGKTKEECIKKRVKELEGAKESINIFLRHFI